MNSIFTIVVVIQVCAALGIIGLVLMQHGKGADMGAAFGSGASGSLFGATGSSNFMSKATAIAATVFFAATLGLAYLSNNHTAATGGVMDNLPLAKPVAAGVTPVVAGAPAAASSAAVPADKSSAKAAVKSADTEGQANQIPK